jgi:hypothetical protein
MPAILLPQLPEPLTLRVPYPEGPQNPPTVADMAAGIKLYEAVLAARSQYCPIHRDRSR